MTANQFVGLGWVGLGWNFPASRQRTQLMTVTSIHLRELLLRAMVATRA